MTKPFSFEDLLDCFLQDSPLFSRAPGDLPAQSDGCGNPNRSLTSRSSLVGMTNIVFKLNDDFCYEVNTERTREFCWLRLE